MKTGGTSVHCSLCKHLGPKDLVLPIYDYFNYADEIKRNTKKIFKSNDAHATPGEIKTLIDKDRFDNYFKFTIVRNPWDMMVSRMHYINDDKKKLTKSRITKEYIKNTMRNFIFDVNGDLCCDFYVRYENLQNDFNYVCKKIGIQSEILPKMRFAHRPKDKKGKPLRHYSYYYDKEMRNLVYKLFDKEIEYFKFTFEDKK